MILLLKISLGLAGMKDLHIFLSLRDNDKMSLLEASEMF